MLFFIQKGWNVLILQKRFIESSQQQNDVFAPFYLEMIFEVNFCYKDGKLQKLADIKMYHYFLFFSSFLLLDKSRLDFFWNAIYFL